VIGTDRVVAQAEKYGLHWDPRQEKEVAVASLTLGVIGVHQIDLAGAYGAIANGGVLARPYLIQKITDRSGKVIYDHNADAPKPERVISAQATYLVTDILADNTAPQANPWWGPRFALPGTNGGRRPATLKTGTTNDFRDLQAFGFLAADADPKKSQGAIVTGVWVGNSDFSAISHVFAADGPTFIWHDYMAEGAAHKTWMTADKAWITRWRGKERGIPRFPLLALDAPLAPAEKCTPGQYPTSTPSPSPSPTPTPTPSATAAPTPSHTPPGPPTPTPGPSPTAGATATPAATAVPTPPAPP